MDRTNYFNKNRIVYISYAYTQQRGETWKYRNQVVTCFVTEMILYHKIQIWQGIKNLFLPFANYVKFQQADVCKTFTSRPFRIPGTPAPNYKNWDQRMTVNSKVLLGLGWATGGRSMFYKHLFLYLLNMLNLKNVILQSDHKTLSYGHFNIIAQECTRRGEGIDPKLKLYFKHAQVRWWYWSRTKIIVHACPGEVMVLIQNFCFKY